MDLTEMNEEKSDVSEYTSIKSFSHRLCIGEILCSGIHETQ